MTLQDFLHNISVTLQYVNYYISMQCYYITNHQITLKQQAYLSPLMFSHLTDCIPYGKHTHYLSFNCSKPVAD